MLQRLEQRNGEDFELWFNHLNALREQTESVRDNEILDQVEQFVMDKSY